MTHGEKLDQRFASTCVICFCKQVFSWFYKISLPNLVTIYFAIFFMQKIARGYICYLLIFLYMRACPYPLDSAFLAFMFCTTRTILRLWG